MAGQTSAIRAGPFNTDTLNGTERRQPRQQRVIARRRRRERLHTQQGAQSVDRRRDVHVKMGVHTTHNRARDFYDGHLPSLLSFNWVQGVARTSREGDRDEHAAANSELDHPPERGVPRSKQRQRSDHQQTSGGPTHWRHRILTGHSGRVADTTVFVLADGRELAWIEYGSPSGVPVIALHGSPGTRYIFEPTAPIAARSGVRLVAIDRPGYGHSTHHPGRTLESGAHDVAQLVDHLGIDRFAVIGTSSGGPNAASCARFLGERLIGCAIVSGPAPPEAKVAADEMLRSNRIFPRLTRITPRLFAFVFQAGMRQSVRNPERTLEWMIRNLPPCDAAVTQRPEVNAALRTDFARPVSPTAARAAVQDVQLEQRPWGFRLADIAIPVHVWHGDLDRNVVVENGIYQASHIPHATLHQVPGAGHWLFCTYFGEILASVSP